MNLEYAAYLLNENYLLAEDADSDGIKYAKKWVTKNFNLTDFGQNATDPVLDDEGNPVVVNQQTQDDQGNPTTVQRNVLNVDDIVETINHFRCIDYIIDHADDKLSESLIKQLHLILKT